MTAPTTSPSADYSCPSCGSADRYRWTACLRPDCPDGHDQPRPTAPTTPPSAPSEPTLEELHDLLGKYVPERVKEAVTAVAALYEPALTAANARAEEAEREWRASFLDANKIRDRAEIAEARASDLAAKLAEAGATENEACARLAEQEIETYTPGVSAIDVRMSFQRGPRWRDGPAIASAIRERRARSALAAIRGERAAQAGENAGGDDGR